MRAAVPDCYCLTPIESMRSESTEILITFVSCLASAALDLP
jgi:hypothetical protein